MSSQRRHRMRPPLDKSRPDLDRVAVHRWTNLVLIEAWCVPNWTFKEDIITGDSSLKKIEKEDSAPGGVSSLS